MNEFQKLGDKTFTPHKMTPLDWALWNSRANNPPYLMEQAAAELAEMRKAMEEALETIVAMKNCVVDNSGMRNEYQDFDDVFELSRAWLDKYAGEEVPFTSPDPRPVTREEIEGGG